MTTRAERNILIKDAVASSVETLLKDGKITKDDLIHGLISSFAATIAHAPEYPKAIKYGIFSEHLFEAGDLFRAMLGDKPISEVANEG